MLRATIKTTKQWMRKLFHILKKNTYKRLNNFSFVFVLVFHFVFLIFGLFFMTLIRMYQLFEFSLLGY